MASQVQIISGVAMGTYALTNSDDTAQTLADAKIYQDGTVTGRRARAAFITVEDNALRYTVGGVTPTIAGTGHVLQPGDVLKLSSWDSVNTFSWINKTAGENTKINVSVFF